MVVLSHFVLNKGNYLTFLIDWLGFLLLNGEIDEYGCDDLGAGWGIYTPFEVRYVTIVRKYAPVVVGYVPFVEKYATLSEKYGP